MREQINNMLDLWYENLTYQQLQKIYGQDNISNKIKDLWYEMSIDDKLSIHEGVY